MAELVKSQKILPSGVFVEIQSTPSMMKFNRKLRSVCCICCICPPKHHPAGSNLPANSQVCRVSEYLCRIKRSLYQLGYRPKERRVASCPSCRGTYNSSASRDTHISSLSRRLQLIPRPLHVVLHDISGLASCAANPIAHRGRGCTGVASEAFDICCGGRVRRAEPGQHTFGE